MKTWERFLWLIFTMGLIGATITFYHINYGEEKETEKVGYSEGY